MTANARLFSLVATSGIVATATSLGAGGLIGVICVIWLVCAGLIAWRRMGGVAAAGVMGLATSLYLGAQHRAAAGTSFCSVSETFNCDVVNRSRFSEIGGIPIAFLGSAFYAAVLAIAVLYLVKPKRYARAPHLAAGMGAGAVLYSAFLAWASEQLGSWCLLCISTYGYNLLILVGSLLAAHRSEESLTTGLVRAITGQGESGLGALLGTGAVVLVGTMGWYSSTGVAGSSAGGESSADDLGSYYERAVAPVELDGTEPILGDPNAPVTVVEFADFQCPSCGRIAPELVELMKGRKGVRLLFKNYPISHQCNDQVPREGHQYACNAAAAGECARQQGRFWQLDHLMFANQDYLDKAGLRFMAKQVGLDPKTFETCMTDPATAEAIQADVAAGNKAGVQGTPTLFIYGPWGEQWVRIKGATANKLKAVLDAVEAGQKLPPPGPPTRDG